MGHSAVLGPSRKPGQGGDVARLVSAVSVEGHRELAAGALILFYKYSLCQHLRKPTVQQIQQKKCLKK